MNAADADRLRTRIAELDADGLAAAEIARDLGCARSTVYKVLADPGPDGRHAPRPSAAAIPEATLAELRRLAADDRRFGPAQLHAILTERAAAGDIPAPIPSESTIARLLDTPGDPTGSATPDAGPPPGGEILAVYQRYAAERPRHRAFRPETALLEAIIREAVAELERPNADPRARPRQREHVAQLVVALLRVCNLATDRYARYSMEEVVEQEPPSPAKKKPRKRDDELAQLLSALA